jgi:hypothetical protein
VFLFLFLSASRNLLSVSPLVLVRTIKGNSLSPSSRVRYSLAPRRRDRYRPSSSPASRLFFRLPDSRHLLSSSVIGYLEPLLPRAAPPLQAMLDNGVQHSREISLGECGRDGNRLTFRSRIFVPSYEPLRLRLMRQHHDAPVAGHPASSKTMELLSRTFYWPQMRKDVDRFVRNCHTCQRSRTSRHAPYGILRPLPIPDRPWQDISMDFVTGLPWSNGCDAIWVVVDRLTKARHLIPCRTIIDSKDLADLFLNHIFCLHGLPLSIVSDRGPQFASSFWNQLCTRLGIERKLSTAFHPQTDGQTERMNAIMEQYLRCYVNYLQDDWAD